MGHFPRWQMSSGGVRSLLERNSGGSDASFYIRKPRAKVGPSKRLCVFPMACPRLHAPQPMVTLKALCTAEQPTAMKYLPDEPALTAVWLSSQSLGVLHLCGSQVSFGGAQRNGYSGWSDYKQAKGVLIGRRKALGTR